MAKPIKKTLLHGWHTAHGANMAEFGGYEMPLWYPSGVRAEHLATLTRAGIFDTSHMSTLTAKGPGAFDLLQRCFTKDLRSCIGKAKAPLAPGQSVYGVFLNDEGETIDDAIIFLLEEEFYMVIVNAGMGAPVAEHLLNRRGSLEVDIEDLTDKVCKLDVQGPLAARVLAKVLADPEKVFDKLAYFTFKGRFDPTSGHAGDVRLLDGTPVLASRTGYTGEFGFELCIRSQHFVRLWETILEAGAPLGLTPCGLAARDSLRAGAVLPLSHQDIGHWPYMNHPWLFALPFNDDHTAFTKDFIGAGALLAIEAPQYTYPFVGEDLRKVSIEEPAVVADSSGNEIGTVLTCVSDMGIGRHEGKIYSVASPDKPEGFEPKGLSCGFVKVKTPLAPGDVVELKDKRRRLKATIVKDIRPARTARRPMKEMI